MANGQREMNQVRPGVVGMVLQDLLVARQRQVEEAPIKDVVNFQDLGADRIARLGPGFVRCGAGPLARGLIGSVLAESRGAEGPGAGCEGEKQPKQP
jgi:hypothetical protein